MNVSGLVSLPCGHSVDTTVAKLLNLLADKGIQLFALIDHSGEAAKVGLEMPPTKLVIFGNGRAGTPLMLAAPTVAIDLPLKILVWQDSGGKVWVSYNEPSYLGLRHGAPDELLSNIAAAGALASSLI